MREKNQKGEGKWRGESKRGDGSGGWEARENGEVPLRYREDGWEGENEGRGREGEGERRGGGQREGGEKGSAKQKRENPGEDSGEGGERRAG